jgi:pilus assembly protein CpaD
VTRLTLPALLAAGLLVGCSHELVPAPAGPLTPTEQFAVVVQPGVDEIQLAPHGRLSPAQQSAVEALAARWRQSGAHELVIQRPVSGPGDATAHHAAAVLHAHGVPPQAVRMVAADGSSVRVGFSRLEAVGPQCSQLWQDMMVTGDNAPAATFGCSTTANFAAQIADPRDLLEPAPVDPADSRRRVSKANSYREGDEPVEDNAGSQ